MRTLPLLALAAVAAACAAPYLPPEVSGTLEATTIRVPEEGAYRSATALDYRLPSADAESVWRLLPDAFDTLGVPYSVVDASTRTIGSPGGRVNRMGSARPGRYLDCGSNMARQYADTYQVYLAVVTSVEEAEGGGVTLRTLLEATARDAAHSNGPIRCTTRGLLEREIAAFVEERLGRASARQGEPR